MPPSARSQHVQRGDDRQACFLRDIDYSRYLQDLREAALKSSTGCTLTDTRADRRSLLAE